MVEKSNQKQIKVQFKNIIMFKTILLFIEKKSDLFNLLLLIFSFFYVFIITKITLEKNVLSLHFFNSFNETMITRGLFTFTFIIFIWAFQIKDGKLGIKPDRQRT